VKPPAPRGESLGNWITRLDAKIAELEADPRVKVMTVWKGRPMVAGLIKGIERKVGAKVDRGLLEVYLQANGLGVVWVPKDVETNVRLKKNQRPSMMDLESLPPSAGIIALAPLHEVFGIGKPAFLDYSQFMAGEPPHWGFDFPGNFYTPAFVQQGTDLVVKVGDDHGAAWDGPAVSFSQYLEGVLATWGSVAARRAVFIEGKGVVAKPWTLEMTLKEALSA